jgi:hypothetical protein
MKFKLKIPAQDMNSSIEKTQCREEGLKAYGGNGWAGTVNCVRFIVGLYFYIIGLVGRYF